jgi:hypothetical protein
MANPVPETEDHTMRNILISISAIAGGVITTALIISAFTDSEDVEFVEEDVSINILKDTEISVSGVYTFKNTTSEIKIASISYPFYFENTEDNPHSISISNDRGEEIPYYFAQENAKFLITLPPEKTEKVHIYFKQPAVDKNFTYILSSTRSWNKPLDKARFTINTNSDINGLNFSYPFELTPSEDENYNYIFTANKFYPETELELSWE